LTNIAAAIAGHPELVRNAVHIVAVMGQRPGHIFHPTEGSGAGMLLGHGPVFRDLNLVSDPDAAEAVLALSVPLTLIPYDAARHVRLTADDLARIAAAGTASRQLVAQSQEWLAFWREDVGAAGFAPFDLLAAAYLRNPRRFDCAQAGAHVGYDAMRWPSWLYGRALLVDPPRAGRTSVLYCPQVAPDLHDWLVEHLSRRRGHPVARE
jgi:inosine-uridine nucleoside N-ribohydrolase